MFFMLSWEYQGEEFASKVLEIQDSSINQIMDTESFNISDTMLKINMASSELMENPIIEDMNGVNTETPLEYGLAKRFLLTNEFSPIKFKENDIDYGEIAILGLCFVQAKESALNYFEPLIRDFKHVTW